jgi:hypothetical protein
MTRSIPFGPYMSDSTLAGEAVVSDLGNSGVLAQSPIHRGHSSNDQKLHVKESGRIWRRCGGAACGSGVQHPFPVVTRSLREKLIETARRREIDSVVSGGLIAGDDRS